MTEPISLLPDEQLDTVNERLRLIRRKTGLAFGTDAFLLAAFVRPQPGERAVDLGSGTGILSLLLCAKEKVRAVTAVELQPVYADLTRRNAALNGMADRIAVVTCAPSGSGKAPARSGWWSPIPPTCGQGAADRTALAKKSLQGTKPPEGLRISAPLRGEFCARAADSALSGSRSACGSFSLR